jgi:hypothetical protein
MIQQDKILYHMGYLNLSGKVYHQCNNKNLTGCPALAAILESDRHKRHTFCKEPSKNSQAIEI